jgi:hypothetical protein
MHFDKPALGTKQNVPKRGKTDANRVKTFASRLSVTRYRLL